MLHLGYTRYSGKPNAFTNMHCRLGESLARTLFDYEAGNVVIVSAIGVRHMSLHVVVVLSLRRMASISHRDIAF